MPQQQNWRWCKKCKSIHYGLMPGVCAGGGDHDASSSMWYAIPTAAPTEVTAYQASWRKCSKCQVLFYGNGVTSCPASGTHDGSTSPEYWLSTLAFPANGSQAGWVGCNKCLQVLQPYQGAGSCPAGGSHDSTGTGTYHMKVGYPDVSQISPTFGGPKGDSFNDSAVLSPTANTGPIRQIFIRAGDYIESIGVGYANGTRFDHGTGMGGTAHTITLAADEHITAVSGRAGEWLDQIIFHSNKKDYGPYGGGSGGNPFFVNFFGCVLQYLFGRAGQYVDQIGFAFGKPLGGTQETVTRSNPAGGPGGTPFDDIAQNNALLGKISRITVRHGEVIDNLTVQYKNGPKLVHGGDDGSEVEFVLGDDEWLTEVRGRAGTRIDAVQFVLSSGRMSPLYGGPNGAPFTFKQKGSVISGFFGRAGDHIEQLGVCYDTARPQKITIQSINYDLDNFRLAETPKALTSIVVQNNSSKEQTTSSTLTEEVSESETLSVSITKGTSVEIAFETEVGLEMVKTKQSVKFGFSLQVATTTERSTTRTRSISHQVTTVVGANSSLKATARVTEGTYDVPWTAQGVVTYNDGSDSEAVTLNGNLKGVQCYGQMVVYEDI